MRSALIATASFASVLVVFSAAATAHELAAAPAKPAAHCPMPKPAKPAHRGARPHCPGARHAGNRHDGRHGRRFASGRSAYDNGVAPSQAFVYGEEKERERLNRRREVYAAAGPVRPPCAHACPPADHRPLDHHRFMSGGDVHSWSSERRETDAGGFVRGERDGRGYGWSWGSGARGCEPCSRHAGGARYEGYRYAGRDENGYLVWPGKTPGW